MNGRGGWSQGQYKMKKKLLSAIIAVTIAFEVMTPTMMVSAEPTSSEAVNESRSKYSELQEKINSLTEKVQELDAQISPLVINVNENNDKIDTIGKEVENKNKEIEQVKKDIEEKEKVLGKRLREVYKSGGQTSYISLIFSANSLSDLITKIDSANKLVKIDKKIVNELSESKAELDEKVSILGTKAKELEDLNTEIKTQVEELNSKKAEQQVVVEQAKAEKEAFDKEFLTPAEKELIKPEVDIISNSNSTLQELKNAVSLLTAEVNSLKSEEAKNAGNAALENGKALISQKEQAEQEAAKKSEEEKSAETNRGGSAPSVTVSGDAQALVNYAYNFLGCPYVWGATGPDTFDCSGFTSFVYKNAAGVGIGRTTYDQINEGRAVSRDELQVGDLVFPHSGHVGIYVGGGKIIHAPSTGDVVKISPIWKFYAARRILN